MPELLFTLNDNETCVDWHEGMTLLEVLREMCGITTVKDGCSGEGVCGCCTILLDGRPALACQLDPSKVAGRTVTTLEGLPESTRQLLARAFVQEGGVQCGFCTPGIATRTAALLERGLAGDRNRVRRALAGHLCRCTGYARIEDAILTAGDAWTRGGVFTTTEPRRAHFFGEDHGLLRPPRLDDARPDGIGGSVAKHRGRAHVLGDKAYVADITVDGMLHAAVVLSEHPRARVLGIDTSAAASAPGVERVLTAADIPGRRHVGLFVEDWPLLVAVGETTRCVGDVLAVVVADSQFHARRAADDVEVTWDVLEPVTGPEEALRPDAPRIHDNGNLLSTCALARGEVDAALGASAHVVDEVFTTQRIEHAFLEPEACLVMPDGAGFRVLSQSQGVHDDQRQIAAVLGVDDTLIHVELVTNGGAFGGKEDLSIQGHAALACHALGRPVRLVLTRQQSLNLHPKRHPLTMHYTVGADADGHLTAVRARIVGDTGAYASVGEKVLARAAGHSCGPYRVANIDVEARAVHTNNPPCGAMRGFGANQAAFAIEGVLDRLAEKLGLDGYDIRDRNVLEPGDRFATGQLLNSSCGIRQTLEAVREIYKNADTAGIACGIKNTGLGNGATDIGRVRLRVGEDGRLDVATGFTEMGQGLHTILKQVIHQETGLDPDAMRVSTCSEPGILCGMTTASRATALCTEAARRAALELRRAMAGGGMADLGGQSFLGEYICDFTTAPGDEADEPITHLAFGYATQVVVLDRQGRVEKVVAAHDVGCAINPLNCAGQIEGSVHMGLGYALSEDFPCTGARPDSTRLRDLGMLRAHQTPEIEVILLEVRDPVGGYGSKGVGEIGLVPTAGAVAAALHAHDGIWRSRLPMSDAPAAADAVPKSRRNQR